MLKSLGEQPIQVIISDFNISLDVLLDFLKIFAGAALSYNPSFVQNV